jgi:hypothetical protein
VAEVLQTESVRRVCQAAASSSVTDDSLPRTPSYPEISQKTMLLDDRQNEETDNLLPVPSNNANYIEIIQYKRIIPRKIETRDFHDYDCQFCNNFIPRKIQSNDGTT